MIKKNKKFFSDQQNGNKNSFTENQQLAKHSIIHKQQKYNRLRSKKNKFKIKNDKNEKNRQKLKKKLQIQQKKQSIFMIIIFFIITGLITGLLSGLLGIGGGVITTPVMFAIFQMYGFKLPHLMHTCIATSLAATMITSLGSSFSHHKKTAITLEISKFLYPALALGCFFGGGLSYLLETKTLQIIFGIMTLIIAIRFLFPKILSFKIAQNPDKSLCFFSFFIGVLSTLLGIGGGVFLVPLLLGYNLSLPKSVSYSALGTLISSIVGSLIYVIIAFGYEKQPDCLGFIYVPAAIFLGFSSLITTSFGAHLAHRLPQAIVEKIFALALIFTGISMILH